MEYHDYKYYMNQYPHRTLQFTKDMCINICIYIIYENVWLYIICIYIYIDTHTHNFSLLVDYYPDYTDETGNQRT